MVKQVWMSREELARLFPGHGDKEKEVDMEVGRWDGLRLVERSSAFDGILSSCRDCYNRIDMLRELDWPGEVRVLMEASARVGMWIETGKW